MKRIALICIILFVFSHTAFASEENSVKLSAPSLFEVNEKGLWVADSNSLSLFVDTSSVSPYFEIEFENISTIAADEKYVYILSESESKQIITRVNAEGTVEQTWEVPEDITIQKMDVGTDKFVFLIPYEYESTNHEMIHIYGGTTALLIMDMNTSAVSLWSSEEGSSEFIHDFTVNGNWLYVYAIDLQELSCFSMSDSARISNMNCAPMAFLHTDDQGVCYGVSETEEPALYRLNVNANENVRIRDVVGTFGCRVANGSMYSYLVSDKKIEIVELITQADKKLTVAFPSGLSDSPRMVKAQQLFHEKYPDYQVVYVDIPDSRILATSLLSGEALYDVLMVWEGGAICSKTMAQAGAIVNLNDCPDIIEQLDKWLDIREVVSEEDFLYAIPYDMTPCLIWVNQTAMEQMGFSAPDHIWTWEEFFDMAEAIANSGTDYCLLQDYTLMLPVLQYSSNEINMRSKQANFDTEAYRYLMENWKRYVETGIICTDGSKEPLMIADWVGYVQLMDETYVVPPIYRPDTRVPVQTNAMVMNVNSDAKEAAAWFMACVISEEAVKSENYVYYGRYLDSAAPHLVGATAEELGLYPGEEVLLASAENDALWEFALENGMQYFFEGALMREHDNHLYPAYMNGDLSLDQYIFAYQQAADMFMEE